jgi:adenylate cyclase
VGAEGVAYRVGDSDITLPLDLEGAMLVPFRGGAGAIKYISIADVVDGRVDPAELKGKHVIVGTTAPGLLDLRATPFSAIYPGVEIHATLLAAMLEPSKALLMVPHWKQLADYAGLAGLAVVSLFVLPSLSPTVLILGLVAGIAGLLGTSGFLWFDGVYFAVGTLFLAFILLMLSQLVLGFLEEYRKKKQFTDLFGQYVPPELVKKMAEDPERYSMAGQRLQMTVLFSDVRGFTSISEQLAPSELSEFINLYLTTMTQVIRDEGGTLDKYIGDAIMAFWGAPIDAEDHAERGVVAAIKMIEALDGLAKVCVERGWPAISIGIGINTGDMSVGDMGSRIRKAYTVMGDAVNLGARLEGLTRQYGVWTIVSEFTVAECPRVRFRELDKVLVKGKEQPVIIYEPVALEEDLDDEAKRELSRWDELLEGYRGQQFKQVQESLDQMISEFGDRPLYDWLRGACENYIANPPPKDWNGVTKFTTK